MNIGTSGSSLSALQDRMKAFQSGKGTITKDDIASAKKLISSSGQKLPDKLSELENNFDKIDTNGDGISVSELQKYALSSGTSRPGGYPPFNMSEFGSPQGEPPTLSKDDLSNIKASLAANGQSTDMIDKLTQNFDKYAGDDGKLSADEFKAFAKDNGIKEPASGKTHHHHGAHGGKRKKKPAEAVDPVTGKVTDSDGDDDGSTTSSTASLTDVTGVDPSAGTSPTSEPLSMADLLKQFVSGKYSKASDYQNSLDPAQLLNSGVQA